jgi:hypothetical protein
MLSDTVETTGKRFFKSELYRLRGELLWSASEIARQQQAHAWDLRAAISMARLWRDGGKRDEVHYRRVRRKVRHPFWAEKSGGSLRVRSGNSPKPKTILLFIG